MDSISVKHIEKGKFQVIVILILAILTFLSSVFALGLGSSSNLDMLTVWEIVFYDIYLVLTNLDVVLRNLEYNLLPCIGI